MDEIFDALGDLLATNFRGEDAGSPQESADAKRFRKVRNWVESKSYNTRTSPWKLVKANPPTNTSGKFGNRGDAFMHLFAAGSIAGYVGETPADIVSRLVELLDEAESWVYGGVGYDSTDLGWGDIGSELQNAFDTYRECTCRKLALKFLNRTFTVSNWQAWYRKSGDVLY